jgi:hypothetical protein
MAWDSSSESQKDGLAVLQTVTTHETTKVLDPHSIFETGGFLLTLLPKRFETCKVVYRKEQCMTEGTLYHPTSLLAEHPQRVNWSTVVFQVDQKEQCPHPGAQQREARKEKRDWRVRRQVW